MNYCTKCQSIYTQPGTCNCYARALSQPAPLPWIPYPYPITYPWTTTPYYPGTYIGDPLPPWSTTITWGGTHINGDSVNAKDVIGEVSWTASAGGSFQ